MKDLKRVRELNEEIRWFLWRFIPFCLFGILTSIIGGLIIGAML